MAVRILLFRCPKPLSGRGKSARVGLEAVESFEVRETVFSESFVRVSCFRAASKTSTSHRQHGSARDCGGSRAEPLGCALFFFQVLQKHHVEWRGGPKSLSPSLTEPRIQHLDSWLHKLERLGE